jgi:two-component system, NtrC family, response regulator GlrR
LKQPGHVLLVDDDIDHLQLLRIRLEREQYKVTTASSAREALTKVMTVRPQVVVTDLRMDEMDGMQLLETLQRQHPTLPVLIITAHGTIPDAVAATQRGAFGFITKPIDKDDLLQKIERAILTYGGDTGACDSGPMITQSDRMEAILAEARLAADSDASVLIRGPTGSGKELLARYIHDRSPRAAGPWVTVNCAAIPHDLLESELFGHTKGAFTGAAGNRDGLISAAHKGTLFLDEIGDMPLGLQAKILRVIEDRRVRPVGAAEDRAVDMRLVSATNMDLEKAIVAGEFREDLFYRLNVVCFELPPLAERREDIPLLVHHFLEQLAERTGKRKVYAPEAMELLVCAEWPGNIRQLRNVVERNVALSPAPVITVQQVQDSLVEKVTELPSYDEARESFTREYLIQLLKITEGNISQAARYAQRNRTDFYKLLNRHGISKRQF